MQDFVSTPLMYFPVYVLMVYLSVMLCRCGLSQLPGVSILLL